MKKNKMSAVWSRTPAEAAYLLRCTTSDLTFLRRLGCGPEYNRVGRVISYGEADIRQWLVKMHIVDNLGDAFAYCAEAWLQKYGRGTRILALDDQVEG